MNVQSNPKQLKWTHVNPELVQVILLSFAVGDASPRYRPTWDWGHWWVGGMVNWINIDTMPTMIQAVESIEMSNRYEKIAVRKTPKPCNESGEVI